jgi:UDP-3-O-[3-hydroxymyristoyl] glucosamine N-acyltransferase
MYRIVAAMNRDADSWTLDRIAALVGGVVSGDRNTTITGLDGVDTAEDGDLVFAETLKYLELAIKSRAAAVITRSDVAQSAAKPLILSPDPRVAFLKALEAFAPNRDHTAGIHGSAVIGDSVAIGEGVRVGAHCSIGRDAVLGDGVEIMEGVRIGADCAIGDETIIFPNVVLYPGVNIGKRCIIHSGAVIGADGFGYAQVGNVLTKIPHIGTVRIEDDVEIGANCCIDRAKTAATVIGSGTKVDNLVHIAHNVRIGRSCLLVSQVGIAGSTTLGDGVVLAGQVGVVDHVNIGDGVQVGAQSGVRYDIPAGAKYFGSPAVPLTQRMRDIANTTRLTDALRQIRSMEKRLADLESRTVPDPDPVPVPDDPVTDTNTDTNTDTDTDMGPCG